MAKAKAKVKKTTPKKVTPKKVTPKREAARATKEVITQELRHQKICEVAFLIAEERNFENGNPQEDWIQAEKKVDTIYLVS